MHHLLTHGVPCASITREYPIFGKRIDLMLSAHRCGGERVACETKVAAFEFKGGAWNKRNALYSAIDADGYSADLDKLALG